jgi:hypothetical protein
MRRTTILTGALVLSLAVNIFAVAFLAGQWSQREARFDMAGLMPASDAMRQDIRAELAGNRAEIAAAVRRLQRARRVVQDAATGTFDRAAVEAAMAEMRAATEELQAIGQAAVLSALEQAAEERSAP